MQNITDIINSGILTDFPNTIMLRTRDLIDIFKQLKLAAKIYLLLLCALLLIYLPACLHVCYTIFSSPTEYSAPTEFFPFCKPINSSKDLTLQNISTVSTSIDFSDEFFSILTMPFAQADATQKLKDIVNACKQLAGAIPSKKKINFTIPAEAIGVSYADIFNNNTIAVYTWIESKGDSSSLIAVICCNGYFIKSDLFHIGTGITSATIVQ